VRRSGVEDEGLFVLARGDVARPETWVTADVLVELGRAVDFPQPAKNATERGGFVYFRGERIGTTRDVVVEFRDVGGAEFVGLD
jgi:hypothetical protein